MSAQVRKVRSPSGAAAVGRITTRGRVRPVASSRPRSNSAIGARNSPAPTSATGPFIGRSIVHDPRVDGQRTLLPHSAPDGDPVTSSQRWTMLAAILGSSMVFLDGTVVNLALPKIGEELPASLVSVLEGQTYVVSAYLAILAALLILAGALADYHGRRRIFGIGLVGFGIASVLCGLAPTLELLVVFRLAPGRGGRAARPGIARDPDGPVRRAGSCPRVRDLGRRDIGDGPRGTGGRRAPGRWRELAGGVPRERPPGGDRPVGHLAAHGGDEGRRCDGLLRLDGVGRGGRRRRRSGVRRDPGAGPAVAGPACVGFAGRRARGPGRVPGAHAATPPSARPPGALQASALRDHQPVHAADLRRAVHDLHVPGAVPPEHDRLLGDGGRHHRAANGDPAHGPLRPGRIGCRTNRGAPVPGGRARPDGSRTAVARPRPGHDGCVAPLPWGRRDRAAAGLGRGRHPAGHAAVRARDLARRRAAHDDA